MTFYFFRIYLTANKSMEEAITGIRSIKGRATFDVDGVRPIQLLWVCFYNNLKNEWKWQAGRKEWTWRQRDGQVRVDVCSNFISYHLCSWCDGIKLFLLLIWNESIMNIMKTEVIVRQGNERGGMKNK